jgi:hypothetical protein
MTHFHLRYTPYFAFALMTREFGRLPISVTLRIWKERSGWKKNGPVEFRIKIGSTNEVRNMLDKELKQLIIAMKMWIEAKTANLAVETELDKMRLKDFTKHVEGQGLNMSDDSSSWPDDFEEDWE